MLRSRSPESEIFERPESESEILGTRSRSWKFCKVGVGYFTSETATLGITPYSMRIEHSDNVP